MPEVYHADCGRKSGYQAVEPAFPALLRSLRSSSPHTALTIANLIVLGVHGVKPILTYLVSKLIHPHPSSWSQACVPRIGVEVQSNDTKMRITWRQVDWLQDNRRKTEVAVGLAVRRRLATRLSPQNRDEVKESTPRQRASHLVVYPFCVIKRKGVSQGSPITVNLTEVAPTSLLEEG